ncbi:NUDIX domain-containing protein [Arthrobacter sp. AG367]|uniref:NUDIX domain-containing protein n=1 Tax=Arthrobacter sp. AG367 TaxID=2572909 RepID=UPI0011A1C880|nr:NUDIX domain-containing protein [Arthrobacter sp. AG367]TWD47065.1 NUDIX domain-containing protein [Arthrobacter sp. AG367]
MLTQHSAVHSPRTRVSTMLPAIDTPSERVVVAVILTWRGRIALFRRSQHLPHDGGRWHCITGFVEAGVKPSDQALDELAEETGLRTEDIISLHPGEALTIHDNSGQPWLVHTYIAETSMRRLTLNWEHDCYRWTQANKSRRFANRVQWLDLIIEATSGQHGSGRQ